MVMHQSREDKIFDVINCVLLFMFMIVVLYPLVFIVSASFSDPNEVFNGNVWLLPKGFSISGYQRIFENERIWRGYLNTIIYTVTGTLVNLFCTLGAAYSLSRKDFMARGVLTGMYIFTMFFSGGIIPVYLVVKQFSLLNTMWALILPGAVSTWNLIVCRTFFQINIPDELLEASRIDGCSDMRFYMKIVLPLSSAIVAVMTLFYAVGHWNSYFSALIYLTDRLKYPLQLILRDVLIRSEMERTMIQGDLASIAEQQKFAGAIKYGIIIVSSVPVLIMYPFVQKYFVKGVMMGSIKG